MINRGIPLAFGVDFATGMAGSLAEQRIASGRIAPVRAAVDGAFNAFIMEPSNKRSSK